MPLPPRAAITEGLHDIVLTAYYACAATRPPSPHSRNDAQAQRCLAASTQQTQSQMRAAGFDVQAATVLSDGKRFKQEVQGETNLRKKKYDVLYESMFDLRSERNDPEDYFSFLVVVLIVHMIVPDTSFCETIFSIMNMLQNKVRNRMGIVLLQMLMTLRTLGKEWGKDISKVPTEVRVSHARAYTHIDTTLLTHGIHPVLPQGGVSHPCIDERKKSSTSGAVRLRRANTRTSCYGAPIQSRHTRS